MPHACIYAKDANWFCVRLVVILKIINKDVVDVIHS